MTNVVKLNNVDHAGLRVSAGPVGEGINQVPVFATEFEAVQRDFPIVFHRGADGVFEARALLGLDRGENLFLDGERWRARHVPALLARGPFTVGLEARAGGAAEPMIYVDLDDPRIVGSGGEPVFLPHGGNAPYLERVLDALQTAHLGHAAQAAMFAAFEAAGLIEPVRLEIQLDDTLRYDMVDFHTIGIEALGRLTGPALEQLHRQGLVAAAVHVASSLGNIARLIALKNARRGAR